MEQNPRSSMRDGGRQSAGRGSLPYPKTSSFDSIPCKKGEKNSQHQRNKPVASRVLFSFLCGTQPLQVWTKPSFCFLSIFNFSSQPKAQVELPGRVWSLQPQDEGPVFHRDIKPSDSKDKSWILASIRTEKFQDNLSSPPAASPGLSGIQLHPIRAGTEFWGGFGKIQVWILPQQLWDLGQTKAGKWGWGGKRGTIFPDFTNFMAAGSVNL